MPKGGHHHLHLTAAAHIDFLLSLVYDPVVFYSEKKNTFKVAPQGPPEGQGFINCAQMREYSESDEKCDEYFRNKILLTHKETDTNESETIWQKFQFKFIATDDLYNYKPFFTRIVRHVFETCVAENVFLVELKHIFGFVFEEQHFDTERKTIPVAEELEIFHSVLQEFKKEHPDFEVRLVVCGLKIFGPDHVKAMFDNTVEGLQHPDYKYLIAGYDTVNEEDTCPPLEDFFEIIDEGLKAHSEV